MNKRKIKIIGIIALAVTCYYGLQYVSLAVHYNCDIIRDDCAPPIYWPSEFIYRLTVRPPWLDQFEIGPTTLLFKDGRFGFWEGEVEGRAVVIRVREGGSPVMQWIGEGLPLGIPIRPAAGEHISQWLGEHPEYELSK